MPIKRRKPRRKKLKYHSLFGPKSAMPVGYSDFERRYGIPEYEAEVAATKANSSKPLGEIERELAEKRGFEACHYDPETFHMFTTTPRNISSLSVPKSKDPNYRLQIQLDSIVLGWWYDRQQGLGPGHTIGAWVATRVGYRGRGQMYQHQIYDGARPRYSHYQTLPSHIVCLNVFRDFKYVGEFPHCGESDWFDRSRLAMAAISDAYEELHSCKLKFKWS